uniref:Ig-like domain-containing protein n=1 Tax=Cyprinodon variegatus TaxID=28743 RepID=A0A3Q2EGG4_CYPVA
VCYFFFLLCLSNADAMVPVMTVYLGEAANFTCDLPDNHDSSGEHFWYKQTTGDTLEVIVKFVNYANPQYGTHYSDSRIKSVITDKMSILTILDTAIEDEGMYHCVFTDWQTNIWHGTYLLIKGNWHTTKCNTVLHTLNIYSLHPQDYVTLQCSVLSDFESKTCPGEFSVFWFRSDKSPPDIIYTEGYRTNTCQKKIDHQTRCVYNFSKDIRSSDVGTYYCAVATCGEILFGVATKPEVVNFDRYQNDFCQLHFLIAILLPLQNGDERDLNYAELHFSAGKARRRKKMNGAEDSVYSYVKYQY